MKTYSAASLTEQLTTFEDMHARYEKLHGVKIDIAIEAAKLAKDRRR